MRRPYEDLLSRIPFHTDRDAQMSAFVDLLWDALLPTGVSWLGFYIHQNGHELVLGPRRDKPACSPISLHGACGQVFLSKEPLIVRDVAERGANYIACDPRDRSEVVVPLFEIGGRCWGVFDVDSWEVAAFDSEDVEGLIMLLSQAGLTRSAGRSAP